MGLNAMFKICYVVDMQLIEVCGELGRDIAKTKTPSA